MVKKRVVIFIDIDETAMGNSSTAPLDTLLKADRKEPIADGVERYVMKVQADENSVKDGYEGMPDVVAHELGHVLAHVFNLPASKKDPRDTGEKQAVYSRLPEPIAGVIYNASRDYAVRERDAEVEAWGIAEKIGKVMGHTINPKYKKMALDTYTPEV